MAAILPTAAGLHSLPSEVRPLQLPFASHLLTDALDHLFLANFARLQLIWEIHLLALTPALAITSTQLFHQLARPPSALAARFLLSYHASAPPIDLLSRILRHGACTLDVFQAVERLFSDRQTRGVVPSTTTLQVKELPKRLFRNLLEPNVSPPQLKSTLLPFLTYLFTKYQPCPSSHKGYPLCAALTEHPTSFPLVRYLLDKGADPSMKDGYAVLLAIDKGDLELVRLLVEGGWERGGGSSSLAGARTREEREGFDKGSRVGTKRKRVENDSPKRRRKADRVRITSKMRMSPSLLTPLYPPPPQLTIWSTDPSTLGSVRFSLGIAQTQEQGHHQLPLVQGRRARPQDAL